MTDAWDFHEAAHIFIGAADSFDLGIEFLRHIPKHGHHAR